MYHFSWVQLIEPAIHALESLGLSHDDAIRVLTTWVVAFGLIGVGLIARMGLNKAMARQGSARFVPDGGFSIRNMAEVYISGIFDLSLSVLDKKQARRHYWLIGGLFAYIFACNLFSVLPGGLPPTDNISNNAAMALVVFVVFNVSGIREQGMGYFKHMAGPVWWLAWLIFPIELVGLVVRPASLSLRLMGNIVGDHTVFGIMSDLVPVVVPSLFLGLGIFVSFLQAFVFTLLSVIYIGLSVAHDEGDGH